jgi:uncharacterized membrane protein YkvA (DUF1232 family)
MDTQIYVFIEKLNSHQLKKLKTYYLEASNLNIEALRQAAMQHLQNTAQACQRNPLINIRLAQALYDTIEQLATIWPTVRPEARPWLAAAILYFVKSDDEEPDFASPIGFEDDTEVLNACLRLAHLDRLCLHPEDYDDVE